MRAVSYVFVFLSALLCTSINALAPPSDRRAFLSKVASAGSIATVAAATTATSAPVFAADYALDGLDEVETKKEAPKKSGGNGGVIVGGALAGGLALSLPFFAPNLARMAGIKNAKQPK